jgi:hypothetical protein
VAPADIKGFLLAKNANPSYLDNFFGKINLTGGNNQNPYTIPRDFLNIEQISRRDAGGARRKYSLSYKPEKLIQIINEKNLSRVSEPFTIPISSVISIPKRKVIYSSLKSIPARGPDGKILRIVTENSDFNGLIMWGTVAIGKLPKTISIKEELNGNVPKHLWTLLDPLSDAEAKELKDTYRIDYKFISTIAYKFTPISYEDAITITEEILLPKVETATLYFPKRGKRIDMNLKIESPLKDGGFPIYFLIKKLVDTGKLTGDDEFSSFKVDVKTNNIAVVI